MQKGKELLQELVLEAAVTRKYLESVPFDKLAFQPTEKSETLGRLAIHVAEIIAWWKACLASDFLDFENFQPKEFDQPTELLAYFDALLKEAQVALLNVKDDEFAHPWSMKHGNEILFTLNKYQVIRLFCMNHLVHHRAQLGVYLRLLGVSVPATYGPSAEEDDVILITPFQ